VIETYYDRFLQMLDQQQEQFGQSYWRIHAGQRFLYVESILPPAQLTSKLQDEAGNLIRGTKLGAECVYVRTQENIHVYRFRFTVPNEKMFCCGNFCVDCIRLRGK